MPRELAAPRGPPACSSAGCRSEPNIRAGATSAPGAELAYTSVVTHRNIIVDARFLGDVESGIGPVSSDSRTAQSLLTTYALILRKWLAQNERLRSSAGVEPETLVDGAVVVYLTLILKRAWSLAARDVPGFLDTTAGEELQYMLNKMVDVATNVAGGAAFLHAHRNIYEAMVEELGRHGVAFPRLVKTCFEGSGIDRLSDSPDIEGHTF